MRTVFALAVLVGVGRAQQTAFDGSRTSSVSLVDLLAASPDHALLLKAFQRARLIPFLNRLNGSTLFAPSDAAIKAESTAERTAGLAATESIWTYALSPTGDDDNDPWASFSSSTVPDPLVPPPRDNLQLALRDTLVYHILNYTLFPAPNATLNATTPLDPILSISNLPTLEETLYHPSLSSFNKSFPVPPTLPGSPPDDPDPDKPKAEEGLLRGEGQKVRIVRRGKKKIWVGVDWKGEDGIPAFDGSLEFAKNGAMVVLDGVLKKPVDLGAFSSPCGVFFTEEGLRVCILPSTAKQIRTNPQLSTLASLLPPALLDYISTAPHLTLFAPTNDAWGALSQLELCAQSLSRSRERDADT